MKILEITPRLPYPLTDGAAICMYQAIRGMASLGHEVHLLSLDDQGTDPGPLREFATVHPIRHNPLPTHLGALTTLFHSRPYTHLKKDLKRVYVYLDRLHERENFDIVHADEAHTAHYGSYMKRRHGIPYVLRCHNIEHEIYRRHIATVRNPLMRSYLNLQCDRWARFEIGEMRMADACAAITRRDQEVIERLAPGVRVETIPASVDLDAFSYVGVEEREEHSMVMLGTMTWAPNRDAAIWFAGEILPRILREIPDAVCYLIGDQPPVKQLPPHSENFRIEGRVPDIHDYFRRVTLGLVPLRVGGGMRVKMVEMMASGVPIVSTTQGAEGNEGTPGEHFLVADDPEEFARAVVRLLRERAARDRIAVQARKFAMEYYSTGEVSRKLEHLLLEAIERKTKVNGVAVR
jgi:glycosyltransferase involved in cell wall biosynthesis